MSPEIQITEMQKEKKQKLNSHKYKNTLFTNREGDITGIQTYKLQEYKLQQGPKRHKPWPIQKFMRSHEKVMRK